MPSPAEEARALSGFPGPGIAATIDRRLINSAAVPATTGVMGVAAIWLTAGTVVTNVVVITGSTAGSSSTHYFHALYTNNLVLLAQSTDDTTGSFPSANTKVTKALTAAQTASYTGLYYVGVCQTASTVATLLCAAAPAASIANNDTPVLAGTTGSALAATAPNPAAAPAGQINTFYAFVT